MIAIIGHGFVGGAVEYGFSNTKTIVIDPKFKTAHMRGEKVPSNYAWSIAEFEYFSTPKFAFICVPTPMGENGEVDPRHIISSISDIKNQFGTTPIIIIKSTVTPSVLTKLEEQYPTMSLVYNPEFLTERGAKDDFVNPPFHIIGSKNKDAIDKVEKLYKEHSLCTPCPIYKMSMQEASYTKYAINSFLATKVIFMNQLKDAITADGHDFIKVANAFGADPRIGYSHTRAPGFDGKPGYGGSCFPKDVSALVESGNFSLLERVHDINVAYRSGLELDDREKEQNVKFVTKETPQ